MDSKYFTSSPAAAKRLFAEEAQDSPSSKRAKRSRLSKKHQFKSIKTENDAGFEEDWIPDADTSVFASSNRALKTEKNNDTNSQKGIGDGEQNTGTSVSPADSTTQDGNKLKAEANTRKARADSRAANNVKSPGDFSVGGRRHPISSSTPAVAGPSHPRSENGHTAHKTEKEEYIPLSELPVSPLRDYTFKAFPDPKPLQYGAPSSLSSSSKKGKKKRGSVSNGVFLEKDEATAFPITAVPPKTEEMKTEKQKKKRKDKKNDEKKDEGAEMKDQDEEPTTPPALLTDDKILAAPAGTRTLKAISKHLKAISTKLDESRQWSVDLKAKANFLTSSEGSKLTVPEDLATTSTGIPAATIEALRRDLANLQSRVDLADLRASIRHEVLFSALLKVASDVSDLAQTVKKNHRQHMDDQVRLNSAANGGADPGIVSDADIENPKQAAATAAREKRAQMLQTSRKTYEQCLRIYTADMDRATSKEEVVNFGQLVVKYAGDLLKTLG
ncbi:hypothetical protein VTJ49DRAFT_1552 [Mycothermus thermophilus]|uniref:Uncharacterized protein n=1 Tax=Humicola insolens TaxID=85995 RepID=A0ABR3VNV2_HUMIN